MSKRKSDLNKQRWAVVIPEEVIQMSMTHPDAWKLAQTYVHGTVVLNTVARRQLDSEKRYILMRKNQGI